MVSACSGGGRAARVRGRVRGLDREGLGSGVTTGATVLVRCRGWWRRRGQVGVRETAAMRWPSTTSPLCRARLADRFEERHEWSTFAAILVRRATRHPGGTDVTATSWRSPGRTRRSGACRRLRRGSVRRRSSGPLHRIGLQVEVHDALRVIVHDRGGLDVLASSCASKARTFASRPTSSSHASNPKAPPDETVNRQPLFQLAV